MAEFSAAGAKAMKSLFGKRSQLGLAGMHIDIESLVWTEPFASIGANADSWYEYLQVSVRSNCIILTYIQYMHICTCTVILPLYLYCTVLYCTTRTCTVPSIYLTYENPNEYLQKSYVMTGDYESLGMFEQAYSDASNRLRTGVWFRDGKLSFLILLLYS